MPRPRYARYTPRTWFRVTWSRLVNRVQDLAAFAAGYCNHRPYSPIPGQGGGYSHWRCALRRHHAGLHRARNYVWDADGTTSYAPVPHGQPMPDQPWERSMIHTRAQARAIDRWHAQRDRERATRLGKEAR